MPILFAAKEHKGRKTHSVKASGISDIVHDSGNECGGPPPLSRGRLASKSARGAGAVQNLAVVRIGS